MFVCFLLAFKINHIFHSHAFILEKSNSCEVSFNGGCCKPLTIHPQTPHWRRTAYADNDYTIKGCTVALHSLSNTRHVFSTHAAQHSINGSAKCSTSLILSAGSLSLSLNKLSLMCCVTAGRQDVRAARVWVIISHFWISSQVAWRGSAATFYGVVLWVEAAVLSLFSQFDGVEGVVDGSAVGPAPGSRQGVVQHSFDRLHRETI